MDMTCPKCGAVQPESDTCIKCQVVISKYRKYLEMKEGARPQTSPRYRIKSSYQFQYGIVAAIIGFILSSAMSIMSVSRSASSTAAIGYLFVPMISLIWSIPFFVFGFSLGYLRKWQSEPAHGINVTVVLALLVSVSLFLAGAVFSIQGLYLSSLVHDIQTMDNQELQKTFDKPFGRNKFVLGAIAENKNASGELLNKIGMIDDPELYERMWSIFDIMGENKHGLSVMRLVAQNKNVQTKTLEHLAQSLNDYDLSDVAGNEKTPVEILIRLSKRKNYLIDWGLARNPSTPQDILSELAKSANEYTRAFAASNPSTNLKDLELLASDRDWNVRTNVAGNPNVSVEILGKLSNDSDRNVRYMVFLNKHTTVDILTKMAQQDSDLNIRQLARDKLVNNPP